MTFVLFEYAVRNLGRSPRRLASILIGNTLVVLIIIAAAAFVEGMRSSLDIRNDSQNVLIVATGSEESIERSEISASAPSLLAASVPGIRTEAGIPFVSAEILSALILHESADSENGLRAIVRGMTPGAFLVHDRVEITDGRSPVAGKNELILGSLAAAKLGLSEDRISVGQSLFFEGQPWDIVGRFSARGTVMDAEVWTPLTDLQIATKRDGISCVVVQMGDGEFADVDAFTKMRVDLELSALREAEYYSSLLQFYRPIQIMIIVTAALIAMAGILGGLNTLYSAFASRVREIGMLQSVGFSRRVIISSLVQEAMIAATIALFLSIIIAKFFLNDVAITFSMGVFELSVNNTVIAVGAIAGLLLGLLGALPPAWRCLRMPIPESLKSL